MLQRSTLLQCRVVVRRKQNVVAFECITKFLSSECIPPASMIAAGWRLDPSGIRSRATNGGACLEICAPRSSFPCHSRASLHWIPGSRQNHHHLESHSPDPAFEISVAQKRYDMTGAKSLLDSPSLISVMSCTRKNILTTFYFLVASISFPILEQSSET